MRTGVIVLGLLIGLSMCSVALAQQEGGSLGKIITVGEDRIVVATDGQGELTFEVQTVQDGDQRVPDKAQVAQIKTLKAGQIVRVKWVKAHDGHYYIRELAAGPEDGARQGLVTGSVITAAEGRVVVAKDGGGQITLEPTWVRTQGKWDRDPWHALMSQGVKPGDRVMAMWQLDEGTHYVIRGISKLDAEGQALGVVLLQAELRENYQQINQLQDQIAQLQNLIHELMKQLKPAGQ
jgi:hypothetical protein